MSLKLTAPQNENYAATVVRINVHVPLEGCDNVVGTPLFGFQAIIGKTTELGTLGIVFPAETQLSDDYLRNNNLYRHAEKNKDSKQTGYIEDNRRVKAMKFRGHRSDSLFMPLSSLKWTGAAIDELKEGDTFDTLNGKEICCKYVVKRKTGTPRIEKNKHKKFVRVDAKFLPEHYDTDNYFRNAHAVPQTADVVVTQKLHGTSIRIANTLVKRKLTLLERVVKHLGVKVQESEYDHVYGSRKVIKDVNNPAQQHFYTTDIWTEQGKKLDDIIPEGFIVYAEVIGWVGPAPIQAHYTYDVPAGNAELYVYRVAHVNPQGRITDLSWDQVKEFCRDTALKHVPELWRGKHADFTASDWLDMSYAATYPQAVPLAFDSPCDEGVCVRVDGLAPYILKAKSPLFFEHETKMLDQEAVDLEAEASAIDA